MWVQLGCPWEFQAFSLEFLFIMLEQVDVWGSWFQEVNSALAVTVIELGLTTLNDLFQLFLIVELEVAGCE